jgi:hypothetical protein
MNRAKGMAIWLAILVPATAGLAAHPADMEANIREYEADQRSVEGFYNLPWSIARFDRIERLQHDWQGRLHGIEFDRLDQHGRVDHLLLRTKLVSVLDDQSQERRRLSGMAELIPFRDEINALEEARWRLKPLEAEAAAAHLSRLPDQIKELRGRIERGKKPKDPETKETQAKPTSKDSAKTQKEEPAPLKVTSAVGLRTAEAVQSLRRSLRIWFTFYDGFTPDFSWWVRKPHEAADKALEDYAKFLSEEVAGQRGKDEDPLVGDPVGEARLKSLLAGALIAYTPQEIVKIGEREMEWCEAELSKAAQEMGCSDNWKAALARVKSSFVPPGEQDDLVVEQARESIRFVKARNLITVPALCEETWRLTMTPPDRQKVMPYAAYAGQQMTVAYASEAMKHEDKLMSMRGNNRHFSRIVTAHELIPGHHLERYQSSRHRAYRELFSTPFFVEGWGLYWELRLWDLKYARSPEDRIGMLFWRMHRAARIIVSIRFHLGTMSPDEMVDFLVERVGHEKLGATSEVRRYFQYSPLYQAAYMVGGLQLYALHQEAVCSGRISEKAFHDAVLSGHSIPIEMVRAELLELPLARDFQPRWRFADSILDSH